MQFQNYDWKLIAGGSEVLQDVYMMQWPRNALTMHCKLDQAACNCDPVPY